MAEKGGKEFSLSRGKTGSKSLATKPSSLKGKDSASLKTERLVQIDSDSESEGFVNGIKSKSSGKASKETLKSVVKASFESLKTGGKTSFETPVTKVDSGKGGKAYNSGKTGGKGSLPQASAVKPLPDLKLEIDLPKNARVLMDCEAAVVLQGIQDSLVVLSEDPMIKIPESFSKALEYCKSGNHYTNTKSVRQVLDTLKRHGATDGEICMIGNVCPDTVDEVYALVPSLKGNKHKNEEPIRDALANLAKFRNSK